jgi:GT2 family glycosyltransferase
MEKLCLRGTTYGTFRPGADGVDLPPPAVVARDLAAMAAAGFDAVRTYTVPPVWMLDMARDAGLRVLVGIPGERFLGALDNGRRAEAENLVAGAARACAGHPAVLAYSVGNELPAGLVRWHGRRRVERDLGRLVRMVRGEDPDALVTYVNFPSTEYLELPFLDFVAFNVYLESDERLRAYLGRLQNVAGDRPLVMTELGLDSRRHGEAAQARALASQVRASLDAGCAGAFVYAWTDEWHRGGVDVLDWDFGLVRRDRRPKPALAAVSAAFTATPFPALGDWPRISVVVCTYNGARTLAECLESLKRLQYPDYEVIVVDDGSTDATTQIARASGFRVVDEGRQGLSGARNSGMRAATGEIIAYIDDDAHADPHWLSHLATTFRHTRHVALGGPNLPPPGDGPIAACVSNSPGNPVHVLLTDDEAEHVPGCNLAVRRANLLAIGGFDPRFDRAGDDVDVCWRLRDRGWTLGYSPAAVVWHHRRGSIRAFWRQQFHYGAAEAQLEAKFPERYNSAGHHTWSGRVYGARILPLVKGATRIYHGVWGRAPFQSMYQPAANALAFLPLMPEWFLLLGGLVLLALMGSLWTPLSVAVPLLGLAVLASLVQALRGGAHARFGPEIRPWQRPALHAITAGLHLMQPLARLSGRMCRGLTPWRRRLSGYDWPRGRRFSIWTERGRPLEGWLEPIEARLRGLGLPVRRGGDWDRWDLTARTGALGAARLLFGLEEHGRGRQLARFRVWPSCSHKGLLMLVAGGSLAAAAMPAQAWPVAALAGLASVLVAVRVVLECGSAVHAMRRVVEALKREEEAAAARGAQDAGAADLAGATDAGPGGGAGPEAR